MRHNWLHNNQRQNQRFRGSRVSCRLILHHDASLTSTYAVMFTSCSQLSLPPAQPQCSQTMHAVLRPHLEAPCILSPNTEIVSSLHQHKLSGFTHGISIVIDTIMTNNHQSLTICSKSLPFGTPSHDGQWPLHGRPTPPLLFADSHPISTQSNAMSAPWSCARTTLPPPPGFHAKT